MDENFQKSIFEKEMPDGTVRYYIISITRDLFDMIVLCQWGARKTKKGGQKIIMVTAIKNAQEIFKRACVKRIRRGYVRKDI